MDASVKKTADGRRPPWLRSFRYRLVFFSAFTITATIAVFASLVFILYTMKELQRVDDFLSRASAEAMVHFSEGGTYHDGSGKIAPGTVFFHVFSEDYSLVFSAPSGADASRIPTSLLPVPGPGGENLTFDPARSKVLPGSWWILPWNCLAERDLWRASVNRAELSGKTVFLVTMISLEKMLESRHMLFWITVFSGMAAIISSILIGETVAGKAMKPLKEINRALSRVSIENMHIEPPARETDREILEIVRHINRMLKGLDQSLRNLQQFTSDAGHELRTPLAIMRGAVDAALLKERESEYYIKKLHEVIYGIEDMQNLVGALLELARLDSLRGLNKREPADLLIVAEDAINTVSPIIGKRGQRLKSELNPAPTTGREAMILRLINNLLENASKHSPPDSQIVIRTHADIERNGSILEIRDNGPGLSPEEINRCFDRFWRAESSRTTPGFGLGLPLVQRIAQIHGAIIEIESEKGSGALFRVIFPLDKKALEEYDFE
jgi:signal transduction histidine kinase